jgi:ubiquinone/menaquinone biosynthesis C-methylase UbiE
MAAPATPEAILEVNRRYHDVAAAEYDQKWGVQFGAVGIDQVRGKLRKLLGPAPGPFERALEIGAGTGYFSLNLLQAGVVRSATCTDISPGMLAVLRANAVALGLEVGTVDCDAAALPFDDDAFDLVLGHAVLHHLPDVLAALAEMRRVLRPGGTLFFAGEPSRHGDRIAAVPKGAARRAAPAWRALLRVPAVHNGNGAGPDVIDDHILEPLVDVHAFTPADLERLAAEAGFDEVRVRGEELLANWFGWANRTLEATAPPGELPRLWYQYAFRGYLLLQGVDRRLLEPRLPPGLFYNLMLAARNPQ